MRLTFSNPAEQLDYEAGKLISLSRDPYFTEYLTRIREMGAKDPGNAEKYRQQMIEKYAMYQSRQLEAGFTVPSFFGAVYEGDEAPIVEKRSGNTNAAGSVEFAVGGIILSILGVLFVLAAGVSLAVNFMTAFYQGIMLYVCCLVIFLFSELLIAKRLPKMSYVLSAMAVSGAFLTTVVNHFYLAKFDLYVCLIIALILTVCSCIFAWKKQSSLYSAIGFIASFLCASILGQDLNLWEYCVIMGTTLLMNLLWVLLPVKKEKQVFPCVMLGVNAIFAGYSLSLDILGCSNQEESLANAGFIALSFLIYTVIYLTACIRTEVYHSYKKNNVSALGITYLVFTFVYSLFYEAFDFGGLLDKGLNPGGFIILGSFGLCSIVAFAILHARGDRRWSYAFVSGVYLILFAGHYLGSDLAPVFIFTVLMLVTLVVCSIHPDNILIKLTNIFLCVGLVVQSFLLEDEDSFQGVKAACLVLSALLVIAFRAGFEVAGQCLATVALSFIPMVFVPSLFEEVVGLGVVFVLSLLINYVPFFRTRHYRVYNWFTFAYTCLWMLVLPSGKFDDMIIVRIIMAVMGLGIMVLICSDHYGLPLAGKYLVIFVYLTYVVLAMNLEKDLFVSAIIMIIALVAVGSGFRFQKKSLRIYGLVLALFVCCKLVFYDLYDLDKLEKTLLYFVIGVIALAIAAIYLVLEKKFHKESVHVSGNTVSAAEDPVIYRPETPDQKEE